MLGTPRRRKSVSPRGLEPLTFGSGDSSHDFVSGKWDKELRQGATSEVPIWVPSPSKHPSNAQWPVDLVEVVAAWSELPAAVRGGILAMVRSTRSQAWRPCLRQQAR